MRKIGAARTFIEEKRPSIQFAELRSEADDALAKLAAANLDMPVDQLEPLSRTGNQVMARLNELDEFNRVSAIATTRIDRIQRDLEDVFTDAAYRKDIENGIAAVQQAQQAGVLPKLQEALSALNGVYEANRSNLDRDRQRKF